MRYFHVPPRLHFPNMQFSLSIHPIFIGINCDDRGRKQLRLDSKKYQQTCEKNRQNIMKRWFKKNKDTTVDLVIPNKDKDKDKDWEVVGRILLPPLPLPLATSLTDMRRRMKKIFFQR